MATHLDLEEQEQLDQLKSFWKQYGNLITWVLIAVLGTYAAWNGWNWWQRDQAVKAGAMYDELDRAAQAGDALHLGLARALRDPRQRRARVVDLPLLELRARGEQPALCGERGAREALLHVAEDAPRPVGIARLRLAGVLLDEKKYDEALKQLDSATAKEFEALVADRRGDVLLAQGKKDEAKAAYMRAWQAMDARVEYRRLIDAKLTALGAAPAAAASAASAAAGQ